MHRSTIFFSFLRVFFILAMAAFFPLFFFSFFSFFLFADDARDRIIISNAWDFAVFQEYGIDRVYVAVFNNSRSLTHWTDYIDDEQTLDRTTLSDLKFAEGKKPYYLIFIVTMAHGHHVSLDSICYCFQIFVPLYLSFFCGLGERALYNDGISLKEVQVLRKRVRLDGECWCYLAFIKE